IDPTLLRRTGSLRAGTGILERRWIRSAGARVSVPAVRYKRLAVLGAGRSAARVQIQQLFQPLSLAPRGRDGRALALQPSGRRAARRGGANARLSRQARHAWLEGARKSVV